MREVEENCRGAKWGCMDCKKALLPNMLAELTPIREKATALKADPEQVRQSLEVGAVRARVVARRTITHVKDVMGLMPDGPIAKALTPNG